MHEFTNVDYAILAVIGFSVILGAIRGFVREAMSLITWIAAISLGILYCDEVATHFTGISVTGIRLLVSFLAIALSVLIVGGIVNYLFTTLIKKTRFTLPDRIVGVLFGFARGAIIVAIAILILEPTFLAQDKSWKEAKLVYEFEPIAHFLKDRFPQEMLKEYLHPLDKEKEIHKDLKTDLEKTGDKLDKKSIDIPKIPTHESTTHEGTSHESLNHESTSFEVPS